MTTQQQQDQALTDFISMCNCEPAQARHYLEACDWDVSNAMNLFFESGGTGGRSAGNGDIVPPVQEEQVRNPIPQVAGRLFDWNATHTHGSRGADIGLYSDPPGETAQSHSFSDSEPFEYLFEPPKDIMFNGSFEAAKTHAEREQKWVLVNIQDTNEFASLQLNRDTWKDDVLKSIVQVYFVFTQMQHNSTQGQRLCNLYKLQGPFPVIAVIDPRTGEKMKQWTGFVNAIELRTSLQMFIDKNDLQDISSTVATGASGSSRTSSVITGVDSTVSGDVEHSEEELMNRAIQASLEDVSKSQNGEPAQVQYEYEDTYMQEEDEEEDEDEMMETKREPPVDEQVDVSQFVGDVALNGDSTRLRLRMLDEQTEVIRILRDAPLATLYAIVRHRLPEEERLRKSFKIVFMNKELANTMDESLRQANVSNASLNAIPE